MPAGRPSKYKPEYCDLAFKFALLGATDVQMASFFGVCEKTLNMWKLEYPEFLQSLKDGKHKSDAEIAQSLYHRAKGYSCPEVKVFCQDGNVTKVNIIKHYPPDTAAAFIWLKNRAGWRDKQDVEHSGSLKMDLTELLDNVDKHQRSDTSGRGLAQVSSN